MKKIKKFAVVMLTAAMAVSYMPCLTSAASDDSANSKWTILMYICGSNLESIDGDASYNLSEILDSAFSEDVNIVIETGGAYEWANDVIDPDTIGRYVRTEDDFVLADSQPDASMSEESTLEDFLTWAGENYQSDHTGLILWNHGGGSISGVCIDEKYGDDSSLLLTDLNEAFSNTAEYYPNGFEFIGFDACLMSTLETATVLSQYAKYMYASQELEPGTGWSYTDIMTYLAENPDADGLELGKVQCQSYYDKCNEDYEDPSITFSVVDLSKIADVNSAFDAAAQEMYESDEFSSVIRAFVTADNFGGNNDTEGYTNMVDLKDALTKASEYVPSAAAAIEALGQAVVANINGAAHKDAGGLSVYYPLYIGGTEEISIFTDICPSTYYLALVDKMAEGADLSVEEEQAGGTLTVTDVYLDEDGTYTVELDNMDNFAYASCSLLSEDGEGGYIFLGEDDDVIIDYDANTITDNFDGSWLSAEGNLVPIQFVSQNDEISIYTCPILLNGESTNLRIQYSWESGEYSIIGTWDGIDSEDNMAGRISDNLQGGDVINFVYEWFDLDDNEDLYVSDDITYSEDLELYYGELWAGDYDYCINVYDIYGNCQTLNYATFNVDDNGELYFYSE